MHWRRTTGMGLGNVLLVVTLLALVAFTVAALSLSHLNYSQRTLNSHEAQRVAESTLALAIRELARDSRFGEIRLADKVVEYRSPNGGVGHLSFWPETAAGWGVDLSTNNLSGTNPVEGFDRLRPVPAFSAQLIASASYRGVMRRVETVIYVPPFPYAIASAGPLVSTGGLEVGALTQGTDVEDVSTIESQDLVSAHIVSNSGGSQALSLGPGSIITGDVRSHGGVLLDPKAVVHGQIRINSDTVSIPKEEVASYDPQLLGKPNLQLLTPGTIKAPNFEGFVKSPGSLRVSGGLVLDNSVLYVDGDLEVSGGVQGSGALFVTGNTHISGASDLSTDNSVALMTQGNVTLDGSDADSSHLQGMIYSEGSFKASRIDLLGVFIQNNPEGKVEIDDSRLVSMPELSQMQLQINSPSPPLTGGNIYLDRDGNPFPPNKKPDGKGPIIFEAYPVSGGGWELADPNTNTVYSVADYAALQAKFAQVWSDLVQKKGRGRGRLRGLNKDGRTKFFSAKRVSAAKLAASLDAILGGGVPPRAPAASAIVLPGATSQSLDLNPSRFLSFKDRIRVLYWRSR
ncbi:MAG: hypothetical protein U0931_05940 [Vulcanimicrobiota bacterium]